MKCMIDGFHGNLKINLINIINNDLFNIQTNNNMPSSDDHNPNNGNNINSNNSHSNLLSIASDGSTFSFIEYFLRLNLLASTANIHSAWEISNPQLTIQFEKRSKNILTLDAWIDLAQLNEDDIVKRGFHHLTSSGSGIKFQIGKIKYDEEAALREKRYLLCKVAIGRAYNATEDFTKIATIPDGYDSFVIDRERPNSNINSSSGSGNNSNNNNNNNSSSSNNEHLGNNSGEYVIKESSQILPTFIVSFDYDPQTERKSRQKVPCENCERNHATVFCQSDQANLCQDCDYNLHQVNKLTQRHIRVPLEAGPQTFSNCPKHPEKVVEFFCPSCSKPVCVHCKMIGHHSSGDAARHKLVTVGEAFKSVSESSSSSDPVLENRRNTIHSQISMVQERAKSVEQNAIEVQQQLEEIFKKAQHDLKTITKKKLNILKGDVVELNRQLEEMQHLGNFLDYQRTGGMATQFILDWTHHQKLRAELHTFAHFRETVDVQPDIRINGHIQVHTDNNSCYPSSATILTSEGADIYGSNANNSCNSSPLKSATPTSRMRALPAFEMMSTTKIRKPSDMMSSTMQNLNIKS